MLFISDDQVRSTIDFQQTLDVLQDAFEKFGRGQAANLTRSRATSAGKTISAMGAVLPADGVMGVKTYPTINGKFNFCVSLFSSNTGDLLAVVQGNALTELRTAAATLLAARALADAASSRLVLFGSGIQARAHVHAFVEHFGIRHVSIIDPHGDPEALAFSLKVQHGIEAVVVSDAEEALRVADVVITATRSKTPLFDGRLVKAGAFVAAIGSSKPDTRELDDTLLSRAACIAVECKTQALAETGDFVLAGAALDGGKVVELGQLVSGSAAYARQKGHVTLYKSVGIGLEDVALAHAAFKLVQQQAVAA
jgi:ornithine cyclodeaminase